MLLKTEQRDPATTHIDTASTAEMVALLQTANEAAVRAVDAVQPQIAAVIDAVAERMAGGGRLFYVGCGTSGRLGVLDASECPPTYGVPPELVVGVIAGGDRALRRSSENAEDSAAQGAADLLAYHLTAQDSVIGLSAAGGAEYVLSALRTAAQAGCFTAGITCNRGTALEKQVQMCICPDTGPEPITGSTRMKAGTAQKMILNMISTGVMVRLGHVVENLMVNVRPTNDKLRRRCVRITQELTGLSEQEAVMLLEKNGWTIRDAVRSVR